MLPTSVSPLAHKMKREYFLMRNEDYPADGEFQLGSLLSRFDDPESLVPDFKPVDVPQGPEVYKKDSMTPTTGQTSDDSGSLTQTPPQSTEAHRDDVGHKSTTVTTQQTNSISESNSVSAWIYVHFLQFISLGLSSSRSREDKFSRTADKLEHERFQPTTKYLDMIFEQDGVKRYLADNKSILGSHPKLYLVTGIRKALEGTSGESSSSKAHSMKIEGSGDPGTGGMADAGGGAEASKEKVASASHSGSTAIIYAWRVHEIHYSWRKKKPVARRVEAEMYDNHGRPEDDYDAEDVCDDSEQYRSDRAEEGQAGAFTDSLGDRRKEDLRRGNDDVELVWPAAMVNSVQ